MNERHNRVSSGSPYEPRVGFSRGATEGRVIAVSGTAPLSADGVTVAPDDPAVQARRCFEIVGEALSKLCSSIDNVIRTRIYLACIADWGVLAPVHGEFFQDVRPASTVLEVSRFIDPEWLIEVEADAIVPNDSA